jgi:hypothetical protein
MTMKRTLPSHAMSLSRSSRDALGSLGAKLPYRAIRAQMEGDRNHSRNALTFITAHFGARQLRRTRPRTSRSPDRLRQPMRFTHSASF